jgi:transposase
MLTELKENKLFRCLKTTPGIGPILAMVILMETGCINRFSEVGNYASYCRCVESKKISNAKKKGQNNRKNGNAYLAWAFIEAANNAICHYSLIKNYYQRKVKKTHRAVALKAVAHKLARACYFIQRDKVEFDMQKAFGSG